MCWPPPISSSRPGLWRLRLHRALARGLVLAWTILGIGMGFGLYEAAFATVAGLYGRDARNAITGITLFAGFASTVGWPMSAFFIDAFRLARRLPRLGGAASRDRPADEPAAGAEERRRTCRRNTAAGEAAPACPGR